MKTPLETLLDEIDPPNTIDFIEEKLNQFLLNFPIESNTVRDEYEAEELLAEFVRRYRNYAFGATEDSGKGPMAPMFNRMEATMYLEKIFPDKNPMIRACKIMTSGAEGGVYGIISSITDKLSSETSHDMINKSVNKFWENLTNEEKLAVAEEYLGKFKDILPSQLINSKPNIYTFDKVLQNHPWMIKRLREIT